MLSKNLKADHKDPENTEFFWGETLWMSTHKVSIFRVWEGETCLIDCDLI